MQKRVIKAGAFVQIEGRWLFMVGPDQTGQMLGIVRIGGHREPGESPWACAFREAHEEAGIRIRPVKPPATYWARSGAGETELEAASGRPAEEPAPLLVIPHGGGASSAGAGPESPLTVLYLAYSDDQPAPSAEAKGLLLLRRDEITALASPGLTLTMAEHLRQGGEAVLTPHFPAQLPLRPFYHLKLLARLLKIHPELDRNKIG